MQKILSHSGGNNPVETVVECVMSEGIGIHIVGLADRFVKESLLRVATALHAKGYKFPGKKIVINITPAVRNTDAAGLDLPIALAILLESGQVKLSEHISGPVTAYGGLDLRGMIRGKMSARAAMTELVGVDDLDDVVRFLETVRP